MSCCRYIKWNEAIAESLKPGARLHRFDGMFGWVVRIGNNNDWACYEAYSWWQLDTIADYGDKISEEEARNLFPVCLEAGLNYRH